MKNLTIFVLLLSVLKAESRSTELTEIQAVSRRFFSQIVVKLDTPVQHRFEQDLPNGFIKLILSPVQSVRASEAIEVFPYDRFVEKVEANLHDSVLKIVISLKEKAVKVDIVQEDWPFQLTITIRSLTEQEHDFAEPNVQSDNLGADSGNRATSVGENEDLAGSASARDSTPSTKQHVLMPSHATDDQDLDGKLEQSRADSPHSDGPDDPDSTSFFSQTPDIKSGSDSVAQPVQPLNLFETSQANRFDLDLTTEKPQFTPGTSAVEEQSDSSVQTYLNIMTGFLILDLILAALYLSRRRKAKVSSTRPTSDPNAWIMEASQNREFLDVLRQALQQNSGDSDSLSPDQENSRSGDNNAASRVEQMIASLSTALDQSESADDVRRAVDPLLQELNSLSDRSGLTIEDLLGRDGQEFAQNLRDLQKSQPSGKNSHSPAPL